MYRFGPSRRPARKRWVFPGIGFALVSWIAISFGFSKFVVHFGAYNETFGGLASVIILLIWLWLTAMVVILGAELNSELERQTIVDTTRGPCRPLGERGATMADFVARDTELESGQSEDIYGNE
jgi:membrane protein